MGSQRRPLRLDHQNTHAAIICYLLFKCDDGDGRLIIADLFVLIESRRCDFIVSCLFQAAESLFLGLFLFAN